jgi:hypothetical protein
MDKRLVLAEPYKCPTQVFGTLLLLLVPSGHPVFDQVTWLKLAPAAAAPFRLAPLRLAPLRLAPLRLAPDRLAPVRLAPLRLAPDRLALARLAPFRFSPIPSQGAHGEPRLSSHPVSPR